MSFRIIFRTLSFFLHTYEEKKRVHTTSSKLWNMILHCDKHLIIYWISILLECHLYVTTNLDFILSTNRFSAHELLQSTGLTSIWEYCAMMFWRQDVRYLNVATWNFRVSRDAVKLIHQSISAHSKFIHLRFIGTEERKKDFSCQ